MMKRLLQSMTVLLFLLTFGEIATAQPASAREHFAVAQGHFDAGRYLAAVKEYKAAYAAAPDKHALLYNIGLAYHRAGRVAEALDSYERYLELDPEGAAVDEVREYVTQFRNILGRDGNGDEPVDKPPEDKPADATSGVNHTKPVQLPPPSEKPAPTKRAPMSKTQKTGWLVGGSGAALLLAGAGTGLWALDRETEVENIYNSGNHFPDGKHSRGRLLEGTSIGLATIGGVAVLTGAALIWWGRDSELAQPGEVALVPFSDGGNMHGLGATGSF